VTTDARDQPAIIRAGALSLLVLFSYVDQAAIHADRCHVRGPALTGPLRMFALTLHTWSEPMTAVATEARTGPRDRAEWRAIITAYQRPSLARSIAQLVSTLVLLAGAFTVMYWSLALPYWITLLIAVPTAGLLVRTFIIMHDCAHGSFFQSRRANNIVGAVTGVLTCTPFARWRHEHALHHASSGDLSRRGDGDIDTLTIREYLSRSRWGRLRYRLYRHPLVMFGLGPLWMLVSNRFPTKDSARSVWWTNLALAIVFTGVSIWLGWHAVVLVFLPAMYLAASAGIALFYVQHQFEDTYWRDRGEWDYATAAIRGSSYFRLPRLLAWFTGDIGLHHVHHLGPRIPNYRLQACHDENALFHEVTILTLAESARTVGLTLWDEDNARLVGFRDIAQYRERALTHES
jgi:omega-6 fatty acid desaturase (delta-12 desaturase)